MFQHTITSHFLGSSLCSRKLRLSNSIQSAPSATVPALLRETPRSRETLIGCASPRSPSCGRAAQRGKPRPSRTLVRAPALAASADAHRLAGPATALALAPAERLPRREPPACAPAVCVISTPQSSSSNQDVACPALRARQMLCD
jgi:hypothetical protein